MSSRSSRRARRDRHRPGARAAARRERLVPAAGAGGDPVLPARRRTTPASPARHAENERLNALCGANRNAKDGYVPKPLTADQTRAPQIKSKAAFNTEVVATLDRSVGLAFLPDG